LNTYGLIANVRNAKKLECIYSMEKETACAAIVMLMSTVKFTEICAADAIKEKSETNGNSFPERS
jgi:hypothetical protein